MRPTPLHRTVTSDEQPRRHLYIIAFAMFAYGLMGLTGPKTAVRGNYIAAVGMGVAVIATLINS